MAKRDEAAFDGKTPSGIRYRTAAGVVEIDCYRADVLRIRLGAGADNEFVRYVVERPQANVRAQITKGNPSVVDTGSLAARIWDAPFRIRLGTPGGRDEPLVVTALTGAHPNGTVRPAVRIRLPGGHHFYGLGHGGKQFDRIGAERQLWNSHVGRGSGSDIAVPLLISNRGYALLFDTTRDARVTVGRTEEEETDIVFDAKDGPVDVYYLAAPDMRSLLGVAADLLGHATMPPLWFLGYLQSTRHFEDTAELRALARTIRARRFPCDGLIFLSTYSEARGWNRQVGHLDFEPQLWTDPAGLIDEMRSQMLEVIIHEYPVLHRDSALFDEAADKGYLLDEGYRPADEKSRGSADYRDGQRYLDFSDPACRRWWWDHHRDLARLGVAGWWLDGGEGPSAHARLAAGEGSALHNVYDLLRMRAFFEGETESRPEVRPVLLCRSGAAGMQRYGAACWSGDIDNTFAALAAQLPLGLNTALSGIPFWGTDIGGFFHPIAESGELFVRWFQFGAFTPVFRSHGHVWREHLPWAHGSEVEEICRKFAELRYALRPYTYSLAWQASTRGLPLMRPLVFNYPRDPRVWELGDEYLWGDDLLVAPVTKEGARRWAVYLPEGTWYDYWTWQRYDGPKGCEVAAPLDRMPLFVREGAVIPQAEPAQHTGIGLPQEITLLCVPGGESRFELYDDDGRTNGYLHGAFAVTAMSCVSQTAGVVLSVERPHGDVASLPQARRYLAKILSPRPVRVTARGGSVLPRLDAGSGERAGWWWEGGFVYVRLGGLAEQVTLSYTSEEEA